ncbi:hypothetical protein M8542_11130 [Amycolatopsis sp. OK19-0408]|uniref:Uncharacterized protein n=1 Tax=Amycolatopsis iheyensis TaxID=2945988 RepID=A0A9X2SK05_9PSEU|nr:hypothetical protein [Amycolatopsis iheyensis]MCR6483371.1 hypothetical protein [Amycolatopsis iheyensis]
MMVVELTGPLDVDALVRALAELGAATALTLGGEGVARGEPTLVRLGPDRHTLTLPVLDERSKALLLNALRTVYADFAEGLPSSLPRRPSFGAGSPRPATVTRHRIPAEVLAGLRTLAEHRGCTSVELLRSLFEEVAGDDCAFDHDAGPEPAAVGFVLAPSSEYFTRYRHHLTADASGGLVLVSAADADELLPEFEGVLADAAGLCVEESF